MKFVFTKKFITKIFEVGIIIKALIGFFEIITGLLFVFSKKIIEDNFIIFMAQQEIAEDPNDFIGNYLVNAANSLAQDARIFAVAYLLFHGAVNIFLSISLVKEKVKNYPPIMGFLAIFIGYQAYKFMHTHSLTLLALTFFDIFFVLIIWLEYKKNKKNSRVEMDLMV
jgi:uncharacterized membrane protein